MGTVKKEQDTNERRANGERRQRGRRPEVLPGFTHKFKAPNAQQEWINIYLTVNEDDDGVPFEVFINCSDSTIYEMLSVSMVLMSRLLQRGATLEEIADDLRQVQSAHTQHMHGNTWYPSLVARLGATLRDHEGLKQGRLDLSSTEAPE